MFEEAEKQESPRVAAGAIAFRLALAYAMVSTIWIFCSGWFLRHFIQSAATQSSLEHLKAGLFVLVTAVALGVALNRYLSEIGCSAQRLAESERRWLFALESAGHGVWDWNAQSNEVYYATPWKAMLGYQADEIGNTYVEWESRVHPEDLPRVQAELKHHLDGDTESYTSEYRMRRKDGSYRWISDRGKVVSRSTDGTPLRVLGTHSDITRLKQAEEALQQRVELQDQLSRIIATVPGMICSFRLTADGRASMPFATPVIESLYGLRPEEVREDFASAFARFHPADRDHVNDSIAESARTMEPWRDAFRVCHPQKGEIWVEGHSMPRREPDGSILWYGFVQDVTERHRAEQALRESEERFRGILDNMLEGCQILGRDWRYRYVNEAAARQCRRTSRELLGCALTEVLPGIENNPMFRSLQACMEERLPQHLEYEFAFPDGARRWFELVCQPAPEGIFVLSLDITERKEAEARLRQLSRAVEQSPASIVITDRKGAIEYVNPKFTQVTGYRAAEILGKNPRVLKSGATPLQTYQELWQTILDGKEWRGELQNRKRNGELYWEFASISPILDDAGEITHFVAVKEDISSRKQLEAQLRQSQKLEEIGQLAGGVAHDFNNILAAVMMHLGLLQMSPNLTEEVRHGLKELETATQRAASLTRQLLMFSRRSVLEVKPLDLNEIVANLLKMLNRLIGEQVELRFDSKSGLPPVAADAGMMEQALMNLVVNARDAMPKGGRISIATAVVHREEALHTETGDQPPGDFVCLSVSDTGCGMDPVTLKRIFEPFFTTKAAGKGTGLGLATVHGIIAQHKGWVDVESAPGRGSVFRMYLPVAARRAEPVAAAPKQPVPQGSETILLVEDEQKVRRVISQALRLLGYQVHEAANGQQAMALWQSHGPQVDLLLTDMVMPEGMTGLELVERLQAARPGLKAIISSGYSAEVVQAGVPNRPGLIYLPKPYNAKVLASAVRSCLDQSSVREGRLDNEGRVGTPI